MVVVDERTSSSGSEEVTLGNEYAGVSDSGAKSLCNRPHPPANRAWSGQVLRRLEEEEARQVAL